MLQALVHLGDYVWYARDRKIAKPRPCEMTPRINMYNGLVGNEAIIKQTCSKLDSVLYHFYITT